MIKRLVFSMILASPLVGSTLWLRSVGEGRTDSVMVVDPDPEILCHPQAGWRGNLDGPINSIGTRGPEPTNAPHRVLLVGDSVGFGYQVRDEDTFARRLEGKLGVEWNVYNAAVTSFATRQEWRYLERFDPIVRPERVIVQWCANDRDLGSQTVEWWGVAMHSAAVMNSPMLALRGGSVHPFRWPGTWADAWSGLMRAASRDGRPAVAFLGVEDWMLDDGRTETDEEAARLARAAGVVVVDPLERFRAEPRNTLYVDHVHYSPRGHEVVAELLASALRP